MQTTLLGLAIALIIALVAALIGPHFVDWNQFRPQFEAQASRALGAPVHVEGMLDARLLPTPTLHLRSVAIGAAGDPRKLSAEKLDVEFSLAAAMRGELRASELSLDGFALDFGLDKQGRVEGPLSGGQFNLGALTVDRLNLAGRIGLRDVASGTSLQLDDFIFNGDVRALAGTMRGEGSFHLNGVRTPFRVSSGQSSGGKGMRVRLSLDPGDRALLTDLDGVLSFDARAPKFEGQLTLARPAETKSTVAMTTLPWRMTSRVKADSFSAALEQVEIIYGPEENGLRVSGAGDFRFGTSPSARLSLSTPQLDADRLLNKNDRASISPLSRLRGLMNEFPAAPIPVQVQLKADQIIVGGKAIQKLVAELRAEKNRWSVTRLDMRAPGETQISAAGSITQTGKDAANFTGPVTIESADPHNFSSWLWGRSDIDLHAQGAIRAQGHVAIAANRFGVENLKMNVGNDTMTGRLVFDELSDGKKRLDATLKADSLNFNTAGDLTRSLDSLKSKWPDAAKISINIDKAVFGGQEIRPVIVEFATDSNTISLDRFNIGDTGSLSLGGSGLLDRGAGTGQLKLDANAPSLERIGDLLAPLLPTLANRMKDIERAPGSARMKLSATLDTAKDQPTANARVALDIDAPQLKGTMIFHATPALDAARGVDLAALPKTKISADVKLSSEKSQPLVLLLGLDRILSTRDGPSEFEAQIAGAVNMPLRVNAKLAGSAIDGDIRGTLDPWGDAPKANVDLAIRRADPSILFDLKPSSLAVESLSSRLGVLSDKFTFDDLDAVIGGSRMRGRISVTRGGDMRVDGQIGIDTLDLAPVVAVALGTAGRSGTEPSGGGLMRGWRGSLAFQALRVALPGGGELRPFGGKVEGDGQSLTLDGNGNLGGGEVKVSADARQMPDGTSIGLRVNAADVSGAALRYRGLAMPEGNTSFQINLAGQGRSAAALGGALSGAGTATLKDTRIAGLTPLAFEMAVRASDNGQSTDDANLTRLVDPLLSNGVLIVPTAKIPFAVKDGRLRVEQTALEASRTRVTISGGLDLTSDQMDARVVMSAAVLKPATLRPEIRIDLLGSADKPMRSLDLASLSSWLAMRSIDRQTQKLDQFARGVTSGSEPEPMTLDEDLPKVEPIPKDEVRIPNRDPRRRNSNAKALVGTAAPSVPAPGSAKLPKPRSPIVLTPPVSGTPNF